MDGMPVMHIGYIITNSNGTQNIPANTWVHSITGTGPYTITLYHLDQNGNIVPANLTANAQSGDTYHMQALVASGKSPLSVFTTNYAQRYVSIFYYDIFNNRSAGSVPKTVTPINPSTQLVAPNPPTLNINTVATNNLPYSTVIIDAVTSDQNTDQYLVFYKKDADLTYSATLVNANKNSSTTTFTIGGLIPNTKYDVYAQPSSYIYGIGTASNIVTPTTLAAIVSTVSNVTLNQISYGLTANWTEASDTPTKIGKYKIDLYTGASLVSTQYTYSTVTSFTGLSPSTTYYVKITAVDIYGESSNSVTSSNLTLSANGLVTDGMVAPQANTPAIKGLFGALQVTWTAVSNPDPVTYEVHISTTNGFTASSSTKYLETPGTFAVIRNLPDGTALSYSTTYYVVLVAKDPNGSGPQSAQASGSPTQVNNGDVATNAISANQIQTGSISSSKVDAGNLLVNQTFVVGGKTATITAAQVNGSNILYTTSGAHGFASGSYVNVAYLSNSSFNINNYLITAISTNTFTVSAGSSGATGSISNQAGTATAIGQSAIKIDATGDGVNTPFKLYSGTGSYSNSTTPFYLDTLGKFSLKDRLYFDGNNTLTVNGVINASSGVFTGAVTAGNMKFGVNANSTNTGIYINSNNYWYDTGNFGVGSTNNGITWDGSTFKVTGQLNATSGTFTGLVGIGTNGILTSGTYSGGGYSGSLTTGYQLSQSGLLFNNNGIQTTFIDASNGKLSTISANIGGWTIDNKKLEYLNGSNYSGLSTTGKYTIYAGSKITDGDISNFAVTPAGTVYAHNLRLSGGTLDIGGTSVSTTGTATSGSTSLTVASATGITSGMYVIAEGIAYGTVVSSINGTNITLNAATTAAVSGSIYFVSTDGAHISNTGVITATGANIDGTITARSGTIQDGNLQITTGSLYAGTSPTASATIGGFTINSSSILNSSTLTGSTLAISSVTTAGTDVISVYDSTKNFKMGLRIPSSSTDYFIYAGATTANPPTFYVTQNGVLNATGASISGTVTIGAGSKINGVDAATVQQQAANALTPTGTFTGTVSANATIGTYPASQIISGANAGSTATQKSNFTGFTFNAGNQLTTIDTSSGIQIQTGGSYPVIVMNSSGLAAYTDSTHYSFKLDSLTGNAEFRGTVNSAAINSSTINSSTITVGSSSSGQYFNLNSSNNNLTLQSIVAGGIGSYLNSSGGYTDQAGTQSIIMDTKGIHINGLTIYGGDTRVTNASNTYLPFTRSITWAPQTNGIANAGDAVVGFAVYYGTGGYNPMTASGGSTTGYQGDLMVIW